MDDERLAKLADYIYKIRRVCGPAWWIGWSDKLTDEKEPLVEKIRGFYTVDGWRMFQEERCAICENWADTQQTLKHGETHEHILGMLRRQSEAQLQTDYDYMLSGVLDAEIAGGEYHDGKEI